MTLDQLRSELWTATYNAEYFDVQRVVWVALKWLLGLFLAIGTSMGLVPLLKNFSDPCYQWMAWVSTGSGFVAAVFVPLLGIDRAIEITNEWRIKWIDQRQRLYEFYLASLESGMVAEAKIKKLRQVGADIEKDSRCVWKWPFAKKCTGKHATALFASWGI